MSTLDPGSIQSAPSWLLYVAARTQWLLAPLLSSIVSYVYYQAATPTASRLLRFLVSAHGLSMAALYMVAMSVFWTGNSKPTYGPPFLLSLLLPVLLMLFALFKFKGHKIVHWLQLLNVACLAWIAFIGIMAVTGDWL